MTGIKVVQVRSETTGLQYFKTIKEAIAEAKKDKSIWKISFFIKSGERIRLLKENNNKRWYYEPILSETDLEHIKGGEKCLKK